MEALDEAAAAAYDIADVASIAYARAWLLGNPDVWRPDEALAILDKHLKLFEQISDARHRAALLLRAVIMIRAGNYITAQEELTRLSMLIETSEERAMILVNLSYCRLQAGDPNACLRLAREAAVISRKSGGAGMLRLLQSEWIIAQGLAASGDPGRGLIIARRVADEFRRLHLEEDSVRAELTCVRLTLASAPETDVRTECEQILQLCSRWPGPRAKCAAEALQYLREMAERRTATMDDAVAVENYIEGLRTARPIRFRPPMPLVSM